MRILYDNIIFHLQKSGGVSLYWSELIKRHLKNVNLSISFVEHSSGLKGNMFRDRLQLPEAAVVKNQKLLPLQIERYLTLAPSSGFDIFHSSYYRTIPNRKKEHVSIVTVHDFIYERYIKGIKRTVHTWQKEKALSNADGIICVSQSTRSDLLRLYPELSNKPIKVVHNGVGEGYYPVDNATSQLYLGNKYGIKNPFVLYVGGRTAGYKNFDLVIEALKYKPGYSLVLVGGGKLSKYETCLLENNLKGKYLHLQYIPDTDLNMLYNAAHCLIYISSFEGFGFPLLEAQKAGCPVIAFRNSSIPEIVASEASMIEELSPTMLKRMLDDLEDPAHRNTVVDEGLVHSEHFSWDKCYNETVDFYKELYEKKNNVKGSMRIVKKLQPSLEDD